MKLDYRSQCRSTRGLRKAKYSPLSNYNPSGSLVVVQDLTLNLSHLKDTLAAPLISQEYTLFYKSMNIIVIYNLCPRLRQNMVCIKRECMAWKCFQTVVLKHDKERYAKTNQWIRISWENKYCILNILFIWTWFLWICDSKYEKIMLNFFNLFNFSKELSWHETYSQYEAVAPHSVKVSDYGFWRH